MKLTQKLLDELDQIMKEDFGTQLDRQDLTKLAYAIYGYIFLSMRALEVQTRDRKSSDSGNCKNSEEVYDGNND